MDSSPAAKKAKLSAEKQIGDLADADLSETFKRLPLYDRLIASEVCRRWHGLSRKAWLDVRKLDLNTVPGKHIGAVVRQCPNLQSVTTRRQCFDLNELTCLSHSSLSQLSTVCFYECDFAVKGGVAHNDVFAQIFSENLQHAPLSELVLHDTYLKDQTVDNCLPEWGFCAAYLPASLARLQLSGLNVVSSGYCENFQESFERLENLECLILHHTPDNVLARSFFEHLWDELIDAAFFYQNILEKLCVLKNLRELCVGRVYDLCLRQLLSGLPKLEVLFLSGIDVDEGAIKTELTELITSSSVLRILVLSGMVRRPDYLIELPARQRFPRGFEFPPLPLLHIFVGKQASQFIRFTRKFKLYLFSMDECGYLASEAIKFDRANEVDAAVYYYTAAAQALLQRMRDGAADQSFRPKAEQYIQRAEVLKYRQYENNLHSSGKPEQQQFLERAEFLLRQALDFDESGNADDALESYSEAVELCLEARKLATNAELKMKLEKLATQALDRAECLKSETVGTRNLGASASSAVLLPVSPTQSLQPAVSSSSKLSASLNTLTVGDSKPNLSASLPASRLGGVSPATARKLSQTSAAYTKDELDVLRATSVINGREYVPFMDVDLKEKFAFPVPYSDKHGKLVLSRKQVTHFCKWVRPEEFVEEPEVISQVNSCSIKQTIVSDCSFIASLAIAAKYEQTYKKRLITSIIYPQNKKGEPIYNPCGKYMIKMNLNGVARKIVIDDYLPLGKHGDLLCSFSNNPKEIWVSLLEKAYMKIMGGYDFPGSNSNIDLHALTGWIPERIAIRPSDPEFSSGKDALFDKLLTRYHRGDCLITLATGKLSDAEADRAGLADCHAYACLDLRKIQGKALFLLKNPWNHLRWKGNYSERDAANWTPELQKALSYNPHSAKQHDDGEFWIDYESVCKFYDVIYVNWNPALFPFTYCTHAMWNAGVGPSKDLYTLGDNPQYGLEVTNTGKSGTVWILLTRHITDKQDFADNREYIAVVVFKTNGKRIFYPFDPLPYIDGVRINSPHYLCKILLSEPGISRYTLVVSQYEKMNTIFYTLRAYSTCEFKLQKLSLDYKYSLKETGEWTSKTAGGCSNYPETCGRNPVYQIVLEVDDSSIYVDLRGPKQFSVGFDFIQVSSKNNRPLPRQSSGKFRSGFCVLTLENVPAGAYHVVPATFLPDQLGPFFLNVRCSSAFKLFRLK